MAEHSGISFVDGYSRLASQDAVGKPSMTYWPFLETRVLNKAWNYCR